MEIGIDSFVATATVSGKPLAPVERIQNLVEEIVLADQAGVDAFGIGEHHREEYMDSAPAILLAGAATRTSRIRLASAVTVLSAADPVRVFQEFATVDLLSKGRAEIIVGRGSFTEAYPLFGLDLRDYDSLFEEKLELLLKIRENTRVDWSGRHRPALKGQGIFPRPLQNSIPIWVGVGGTPESFVRAGLLGLPLMVAIIGGQPHRFRPLVDLYREAGQRAGHAPQKLQVGVHCLGYVAETAEQAADDFFPGYAAAFTKIGKERGWPSTTRLQFDALRAPRGALIVGDPATVAEKMLEISESLGGLSRISFQMSVAALPHAKQLKSIELLGSEVIPRIRKAEGKQKVGGGSFRNRPR